MHVPCVHVPSTARPGSCIGVDPPCLQGLLGHRERELKRAQARMADLQTHLDHLAAAVSAPLGASRAAGPPSHKVPPAVGAWGARPAAEAEAEAGAGAGTRLRPSSSTRVGDGQGLSRARQLRGQQPAGATGCGGPRPPLQPPPLAAEGSTPSTGWVPSSGIGRMRMASGVQQLEEAHLHLERLAGLGPTRGPQGVKGSLGGGAGAGSSCPSMHRRYLAGLDSDTTVESDTGY